MFSDQVTRKRIKEFVDTVGYDEARERIVQAGLSDKLAQQIIENTYEHELRGRTIWYINQAIKGKKK